MADGKDGVVTVKIEKEDVALEMSDKSEAVHKESSVKVNTEDAASGGSTGEEVKGATSGATGEEVKGTTSGATGEETGVAGAGQKVDAPKEVEETVDGKGKETAAVGTDVKRIENGSANGGQTAQNGEKTAENSNEVSADVNVSPEEPRFPRAKKAYDEANKVYKKIKNPIVTVAKMVFWSIILGSPILGIVGVMALHENHFKKVVHEAGNLFGISPIFTLNPSEPKKDDGKSK